MPLCLPPRSMNKPKKYPSAQYQKNRTLRGVCLSCVEPIERAKSKIYCEKHLLQARQKVQVRRAQHKRNGLCTVCSEPVAASEASKFYCAAHLLRNRERVARHRAAAREKKKL
jgi:hypothetical protein